MIKTSGLPQHTHTQTHKTRLVGAPGAVWAADAEAGVVAKHVHGRDPEKLRRADGGVHEN